MDKRLRTPLGSLSSSFYYNCYESQGFPRVLNNSLRLCAGLRTPYRRFNTGYNTPILTSNITRYHHRISNYSNREPRKRPPTSLNTFVEIVRRHCLGVLYAMLSPLKGNMVMIMEDTIIYSYQAKGPDLTY